MIATLDGKVAIITGASRGIGAAIARRFAAEGAKVALVARTEAPGGALSGSLAEVAEVITAAGGSCVTIPADLADPASLPRIVDTTVSAFGGVDILVNNAAWSRFPPVWEARDKQIRLAFQMNVFTPQLLSQLVQPHMRSKGSGWIINISSATADFPPPAPWDTATRIYEFNHSGHPTIYGASKSALNRLTAGWAIELAGSGIAVSTLAPVGAVASEGAVSVGGWDEERDHVEPVEAMAEAALLLASRSPEQISGRIAFSLPLLEEFGVSIKSLDGSML